MKSRLIRTLMVVFCLVAGAPATQANTESSLCRIVSLPSLCSQGGASASNADSTGAGSVMPPRSSSISLDLKPAVQNSGVGGGIEGIAARIAEEVQSNLRALTNHPVIYGQNPRRPRGVVWAAGFGLDECRCILRRYSLESLLVGRRP